MGSSFSSSLEKLSSTSALVLLPARLTLGRSLPSLCRLSSSPHSGGAILIAMMNAHLVMIAGIVLIATGVKQVVASSVGPNQEAAWLLAGGMAVYLCGDAWFRWVMGIRPLIAR